MTHYIYPQNLKATANMWLWSLRDFAIMGVAALISIVILVELHLMLPAAATLCYGFLTIRIQPRKLNQCHIQIKKEDSVLMKDITDILNGVIRNPEIIQSAQPSQAEAPIEQRRLDNEIARVLEGYDFDKDALREKLYQRASLGYLQVGDEAYVEHKLKNTLEQHDILDCFDSELTNKIVKRIRLAESGSVSIILINDQEIRKEQTDHASSNTSDAT